VLVTRILPWVTGRLLPFVGDCCFKQCSWADCKAQLCSAASLKEEEESSVSDERQRQAGVSQFSHAREVVSQEVSKSAPLYCEPLGAVVPKC
jgi:hypothetical protein